MVLGTVGPHDSIFIIEGDQTTKSMNIRNACLSVIHSYMSSKDKMFIREQIFQLFNLEEIKAAREVLYTSCDPEVKYKYNGPRSTTNVRDKLNDAFEGIFSKLVKLDAEDSLPKFSVPSEDLMRILTVKDKDHSSCDTKFERVSTEFRKLSTEMSDLKQTFHSFVSVVTSDAKVNFDMPAGNGIPLGTRQRLLSTGSKRSAGDLSEKDDVLTETDNEGGFEFPSLQRKRMAKRPRVTTPKKDAQPKHFSDVVKTAPKAKPKPPAAVGTVKSTSSFKGAVDDIFMYNCDLRVSSNDIIDWFKGKEIIVRSVEKLSHQYASRTSFKVTPANKGDHDKIISGEYLPEGIAVRKFIHRRWNSDGKAPNFGIQQQYRPNPPSSHTSSLIQAAEMELDNIIQSGTSGNNGETLNANNDE